MIRLDGLLGREFKHGSADCYGVMRDFYRINFGLDFPDVARPDSWWEPDPVTGQHMNIYMDGYRALGFQLVHDHPLHWRAGDVVLMAVRSTVANHGGILLPGNKILHHLVGQVSCIEDFGRPFFRNQTVAVLRHPEVDPAGLVEETLVDAWDLVPKRIREQIEANQQGSTDA